MNSNIQRKWNVFIMWTFPKTIWFFYPSVNILKQLEITRLHSVLPDYFSLPVWSTSTPIYSPKSYSPMKIYLNIKYSLCSNKFVDKNCPFYLNEIFEFSPQCRIDKRNGFAELKHSFRKTNTGQKTLSYIGPSLWTINPKP